MKLALVLLACAFSLPAQLIFTTDNADEVKIRNTSAGDLTAFAVRMPRVMGTGPSNNVGVAIFDAVIGPEAALAPNGERFIQRKIRYGSKAPEDVAATAAIFADGSSTGDPVLINSLLARRSNLLLAIDMSLEAFADGERQGASLYDLIGRFKRLSEGNHRWYLSQDQQIGLTVYEPILAKLMHMPKSPQGSPDVLAAYLAQETAALRKRRLVLSESQPSLGNRAN